MIAFACPKCRCTLQRADAEAGTATFCPSCNQRLVVPSLVAAPVAPVAAAPIIEPPAFSFDDSSTTSTRQRRSQQHSLVSFRGLATAGSVLFVVLVFLCGGFVVFDAYWQSARTSGPGSASGHEDYITDSELREASLALRKSAASLNQLSEARKQGLRPAQLLPYYEAAIDDQQTVIAAQRIIASHNPTSPDHKKVADEAKAAVKQQEKELRRLLAEYKKLGGV